MKKSLAKKVTLSILAGAVLMSSSVVWAAVPYGWTDESIGYVRDADDNHDGTVPNGDYSRSFYGAYANGDVSDGKVTITDGQFGDLRVEGGCSTYGSANNNTVKISGGKFNDTSVYGGESSGTSTQGSLAENNTVDISKVDEGSTFGDVYGGNSMNGTVNKNKVILSAVDAIFNNSVYGGYSAGSATGNTVNISGGKFTWPVYGGYSTYGNATGNTVNISGGTVDGNVFGGFADSGDATNNTVTISGDANLENAELYGGGSYNLGYVAKYGGTGAPNTLNIGVDDELKTQLAEKGITVDVGAWNNKKVKSIQGFDVINFAYVNWVKDGTVVEVTDKLALNNTEIKVGTVNVAGGTTLANGDKMALISATGNGTMTGTISNNLDKVIVNYGVAEKFNGYVEQVDNDRKIYLKLGDGPEGEYTVPVTPPSGTTPGGGAPGGGTPGGGTPEPERNDQVLVLGESRAAAVAFTNQGSELIETGLNALARDNSKDTKVFAAVYGNHSEYETGSHVNVNGWSGIVGIGKTNANGLTVGAFFENGEGNYSTHNIFTADYIRGDGEACYNGGGLLVRKDNANGVYAEASLRAGNLQNELRNAVRNGADLTGYDVDTFYYAAHIGIGKVIPRGADGDSLDVYGKFIYTHHDGETFDVGGTPTKFDSVESERLRLGFRLNEVQTNKLSMYYGAAWEYEFNGDAHDKIASFDLETPSLEGSTVIGEVGAHYKASEKWSLDLNARAYTGQREGFSGSVQANYSF